MFKATPFKSSKSAIVNPRSAMTVSPASNKDKSPHRSVSSRSDMLSPYSFNTKHIPPDGLTASKAFRVLGFLYEECINCCAWEFEYIFL
jgi:hypothetical protein